MNIDDLTLGQIKQLQGVLQNTEKSINKSESLNCMIGQKVIIRTYSAGVWFGILDQKANEEVILKDARRMYQWWAKEGISLSAVALYGIKQDKSKIVEKIPYVWLQAIEIIPCSEVAIKDLEEAQNVKAN